MSVLRSSAPIWADLTGFSSDNTRRSFRLPLTEHTGNDRGPVAVLSVQGPRPRNTPGLSADCAQSRSE